MQLPQATFCPLIKDECITFKCKFWVHLLGQHPQKQVTVDEYDCAVGWLPLLLIENAKEVRQGAAATESFRNEVLKINNQLPNLTEISSQSPVLTIESSRS